MTYRELIAELNKLTEEQLNMDITVEDAYENECYPARFDICSSEHELLDDGHPVIVF